MEKLDFILSIAESQGEKQLCITHHKDITEEEYNRILEAALFCDLEIHPDILFRLEEEGIGSGLYSMTEKDFQQSTVKIIHKEQFESMILNTKNANKAVRELFGLPVALFEYFEPLPDAYRDGPLEDSPYKEDIPPAPKLPYEEDKDYKRELEKIWESGKDFDDIWDDIWELEDRMKKKYGLED
jgi:hypothetical protein